MICAFGRWPRMLCLALILNGCRTAPRLPAMNLDEPGWKVRSGQAVWISHRSGSEIAGELLVATHPDGRSLAQFTKTPLPLLAAQASAHGWRIEFSGERRAFAGSSDPPARWLWLHVARCLAGAKPPEPLRFESLSEGTWRLNNPATGESVAGYLSP